MEVCTRSTRDSFSESSRNSFGIQGWLRETFKVLIIAFGRQETQDGISLVISGLTPVEVEVSARHKQNNQVTSNESQENAQVPPPVIKGDAQRLIELIAHFIRAILARAGGVVDQVSRSSPAEEGLHVVAARLSVGSREALEFVIFADNG